MLNKVLKWASNRYLSEYLDGIDDLDLSVQFLSGKINLKNLMLKRDLLQKFESPVLIHNSLIDEVSINIPWRSFTSEPVEINVKNFFLLVKARNSDIKNMPYEERLILIERTKKLVLQMIKLFGMDSTPSISDNEHYKLKTSEDIDAFHERQMKSNEKGFLMKYLNRVIDNARVSIENIHIRYEDEFSNKSHPYSLGITLDSVKVYPMQNQNETFFTEYQDCVERNVEVKNLAIYLNSFEGYYSFNHSNEMSQFIEGMKSTIYKDSNTSPQDAFANSDIIPVDSNFNANQFILQPLSLDMTLTLNRVHTILRPKIDIKTDVSTISLNLTRGQYSRVIDSVSHYNKYYRTLKYGYFSTPVSRPAKAPVEWWIFAIRCVKNRVRENHVTTSINRLIKQLRYMNLQRKMIYNGKLDKSEKEYLEECDENLPLNNIIESRKIAKMSIEKDVIEGNLKKLSFVEKLDPKIKIGATISVLLLMIFIFGMYIGVPVVSVIVGLLFYKKYLSLIMSKVPDVSSIDQSFDNMEKLKKMIEINGSGMSDQQKVLKTKRLLLGSENENAFHRLFEEYITEQIAKSNEIINLNVNAKVHNINLSLAHDRETKLANLSIEEIDIYTVMRNSSSMHGGRIQEIVLEERITQKDEWHDVLRKRKLDLTPIKEFGGLIEDSEEKYFVDTLVEINPLDKSDIDLFVKVESSQFDVTVNKRIVDEMMTFFLPSSKNVNEVKDVTRAGVKFAVRSAEESIKSAIEEKKRILLDITIPGPMIHVYAKDNVKSNELVLYLGRLDVKSNPKSVIHSESDLTDEDSSFYDKYTISLYDINCYVNAREPDSEKVERLTLIHNFGIRLDVDVCIVGSDVLPKMVINANMKKLLVSISQNRIGIILDILKSQLEIPAPKVKTIEVPKDRLHSIDKDIKQLQGLEVVQSVTSVPYASIMKLNLWIGTISFEYINDTLTKGRKITPSTMSVAEVSLSNFKTKVHISTHNNDISVSLDDFNVIEYITNNFNLKGKYEESTRDEDIEKRMEMKHEELNKQIYDEIIPAEEESKDFQHIEDTSMKDRSYLVKCIDTQRLIQVDVKNTPILSPDYDNTDFTVSIRIGDIQINVIRHAISHILLHVNQILQIVESKKISPQPTQVPVKVDKVEEDLLEKRTTTSEKRYSRTTYLASVNFQMTSVQVSLLRENEVMIQTVINNIQIQTQICSDMSISTVGSLEDFSIYYVEAEKQRFPILKINREKALQFSFSKVNDPSVDYDISVSVDFGAVRLTFVNKIIQDLSIYFNQLLLMLQKVDEMSKTKSSSRLSRRVVKKMKSDKSLRSKINQDKRQSLHATVGRSGINRKYYSDIQNMDELSEEINNLLNEKDSRRIKKSRSEKKTRSDDLEFDLSPHKKERSTPKRKTRRTKSISPNESGKLKEAQSAKPVRLKLNVSIESPQIVIPKSLYSKANEESITILLGNVYVFNKFVEDQNGLIDSMHLDVSGMNLVIQDKENDIQKSLIDDTKCTVEVDRFLNKLNKDMPTIGVNVTVLPITVHMSQIHALSIVHVLVHNLQETTKVEDTLEYESYFKPLRSKKKKRQSIQEIPEIESLDLVKKQYDIMKMKDQYLEAVDNFDKNIKPTESNVNILCKVSVHGFTFLLEDNEKPILSIGVHDINTQATLYEDQSASVKLSMKDMKMKDHMNEDKGSFSYLISRETKSDILVVKFEKYVNNNKKLSCKWSNTCFIFIGETVANIMNKWKSTIEECLEEMDKGMSATSETSSLDVPVESASVTATSETFTYVNILIDDIKFFILQDRNKEISDALFLCLSDTSLGLLLDDKQGHVVSEFQMDGLSMSKSKIHCKTFEQTRVEKVLYPFDLTVLFFLKDKIEVAAILNEFSFIVSYRDLMLVKDITYNQLLPLSKKFDFKRTKKPIREIDTPIEFKQMKIHIRFSNLILGLIDDRYYNDYFLPLLRTKIGGIETSLVMNSIEDQDCEVNIKNVDAYSFNNHMSGWEPIIEPYYCGIRLNKAGQKVSINLDSTETLNMNLTNDLINTTFNTMNVLLPSQTSIPGEEQKRNETYPIIMKNRLGRKVEIGVILGDEQIQSNSIEDSDELFVILNRNDRLLGVQDDINYKLRINIDGQTNSPNIVLFNRVDKIIIPYHFGSRVMYCLCEIRFEEGTRIITFHGGVKMENKTSYNLKIWLLDSPKGSEDKKKLAHNKKEKDNGDKVSEEESLALSSDSVYSIKKNSLFYLPLFKNHIRCFAVSVDGFEMSNAFNIDDNVFNSQTLKCNSLDHSDQSMWICSGSSRLSANNFDYHITFEPHITIENLLTVPIETVIGLKNQNYADTTHLDSKTLKKMEKERKKREKKAKKSKKTLDKVPVSETESEDYLTADVKSSESNIFHSTLKGLETLDVYVFTNFDDRLSLSLKLENYKWSSYMRVMDKSTKIGHFSLQSEERPNTSLTLNGEVSTSETGNRRIIIYSQYWIINDTGLRMFYSCSKDVNCALKLYQEDEDMRPYETSDQKKWYSDEFIRDESIGKYYYHGEKKLHLKVDGSSWSKQLFLATRDEGLIVIDDHESQRRYCFHANYQPAPSKFWRTTIVTLSPAYWILNKSKTTFYIEQPGSSNTYQKIKKNGLIPFHYPSYKKDTLITLNIGDNSVPSNPISMDIVGRFPLKIQKVNSHEYFFYTLRIIKEAGSPTQVIIEDDVEESYYKITNNTKFDMILREGKSELTTIIKSRKSVPFSFSFPQETKKHVYLKFLTESNEDKWEKFNIGKVTIFDPFTLGKDIIHVETVSLGRVIELRVRSKREKKRLKKRKSSTSNTKEESQDGISLDDLSTTSSEGSLDLDITVQINIHSVGISLIDNTPQEVMYLFLKDIDIFYKLDKEEQSLELKLNLQIDNTLYSTPNPIIMHQSKAKDPPPLIHFAVYKDQRYKNIECFRYFAFKMNEIDFKVDEAFLMYLLYWSTSFVDNFNKLNPVYTIENQIMNEAYRNTKRPSIINMTTDDNSEGGMNEFFFETFHLNPLHVNVSFTPTSNYDHPFLQKDIDDMSRRIMRLVTAVDNAPIRLSGLLLNNSFSTREEFINRVVSHYTTMIIRQGLAILGSTDFLGNPVSLVQSLGTGAFEFVHEPAQGMVASPKEFGKGLAKGTSSLVKNTLGGVFSSAQKIVGSVGNLGAKFTFDDEYKKERDVQKMKKAKHFGEGLGYGFKELGTGLYKGMTGLVTQPVKNAQKDGIKGLGKGVVKGVIGVVVKPTVGVVDLVSRTAEGIKSTAFMFDGDALRVRNPRHISNHLLVSNYDPVNAEGQFLLRTILKGKYRKEFYAYHKILDKKRILLISHTHMMVLKMNNLEKIKIADKWSVSWRVRLTKLDHTSIERVKSKKVHTIVLRERPIARDENAPEKGTKARSFKIKCESEEVENEVMTKIVPAIKYASISGGEIKRSTHLFGLRKRKGKVDRINSMSYNESDSELL